MRGKNLDAAREAKKVKAANRKIAAQKRLLGRLCGRRENQSYHTIDEYFKPVGEPVTHGPIGNTIFREIAENLRLPPNRRRYSTYFRSFSLLLMSLSLPAYMFLRMALPFPSRQSLLESLEGEFWIQHGIVTDYGQMEEALADYVREIEPRTERKGILAVDAISLTPHMRIERCGFVTGLVSNETLTSALFRNLSRSYKEYEKCVVERANVTITDSFVYQFQPLNASMRCITVFVEPSTTGKASSREVSRLYDLKKRLADFNLTVVGFAFDGDSAYSKMHERFFHGYSMNVSHDVCFQYDAIETPLIISDPLHLLKRARYRLVSKNIDIGMSGEERLINVSRMKQLFDLPANTWSNSLYTKMHDDLAESLLKAKMKEANVDPYDTMKMTSLRIQAEMEAEETVLKEVIHQNR